MTMLKLTDLDIQNKRVLIREDLNVPVKNGKVVDDARIRSALPTIEYALEHDAAVILMSHLGRPAEGEFNEEYSLAPVAAHLSELLNQPVTLISDWSNGFDISPGKVVMCENVRMLKGERDNDEVLAKHMAALCDIFVMDAFGTAHRAQASTHGVACFAPVACAGPLLVKELNSLHEAMQSPTQPIVAIVGGAKVSTKLRVLKSLMDNVDHLIVGGGIANTFLAAAGFPIGESLYEESLIDEAQQLLAQSDAGAANLPLPVDVVVAKEFSSTAEAEVKLINDVADDDKILDIGPATIELYTQLLKDAKTIVWNGPVGVFEYEQFSQGTQALAHAVADSSAFSVAGGGDTLMAVNKYNVADKISYITTGGGAFLKYLEGKPLPAVEVLEQRAHDVQ